MSGWLRPFGGRIQPVALIALHSRHGDLERLYRFFAEWEVWTAEILESHVSYPMLAYFRSQHAEPYLTYRRGRRAVEERSGCGCKVPLKGKSWLYRELFEIAYGRLQHMDLPLRDVDDAWDRLQRLRTVYGVQLQSLIDYLVAPAGFWGHSAELP